MRNFNECQPLISRLREADISVEERLEEFQNQAKSGFNKRFSQLAAVRYYLRTALWRLANDWDHYVCNGVTNYKTLLDDLERWQSITKEPICIVTFNYDRLLESAFPAMEVVVEKLDDYVRYPHVKIFKLHGSVDWVRSAVGPGLKGDYGSNAVRFAHIAIMEAEKLTLGAIDKISSWTEFVVDVSLADRNVKDYPRVAWFPAVAIPVVEKNESQFECPPEHIKALNAVLPETRKVLSIGWRGAEKHFLDKMNRYCDRRDRLDFMIVGANVTDADETAKKFREGGLTGSFRLSDVGFTDSLVKNKIEEFLYTPSDPGGDYKAL